MAIKIKGDTVISDEENLTLHGDTHFLDGTTTIGTDLIVENNLFVQNDADITSNLGVQGLSTLGDLLITGEVQSINSSSASGSWQMGDDYWSGSLSAAVKLKQQQMDPSNDAWWRTDIDLNGNSIIDSELYSDSFNALGISRGTIETSYGKFSADVKAGGYYIRQGKGLSIAPTNPNDLWDPESPECDMFPFYHRVWQSTESLSPHHHIGGHDKSYTWRFPVKFITPMIQITVRNHSTGYWVDYSTVVIRGRGPYTDNGDYGYDYVDNNFAPIGGHWTPVHLNPTISWKYDSTNGESIVKLNVPGGIYDDIYANDGYTSDQINAIKCTVIEYEEDYANYSAIENASSFTFNGTGGHTG